jgi:hypothetical protein
VFLAVTIYLFIYKHKTKRKRKEKPRSPSFHLDKSGRFEVAEVDPLLLHDVENVCV